MRVLIATLVFLNLSLSFAETKNLKTAATDPYERANQLLSTARELEESGKIDAAISAYRNVLNGYGKLMMNDSEVEESYGAWAQEKIDVLECKRSEKNPFTAPSSAKLVDSIRAASRSKSADDLTKIVACGFFVGKSESEYIWRPNPSKVMADIQQFLKKLNWDAAKGGGSDTGGRMWYQLDDAMDGIALEKDSKGWRWTGFTTSEESLLKKLEEHSKGGKPRSDNAGD